MNAPSKTPTLNRKWLYRSRTQWLLATSVVEGNLSTLSYSIHYAITEASHRAFVGIVSDRATTASLFIELGLNLESTVAGDRGKF
jgi:hypothetical protein